MSKLLRRIVQIGACCLLLQAPCVLAQSGGVRDWTSIVRHTNASVVWIDLLSGKVSTSGPVDRVSLPGSTLKPLVLRSALALHVVSAQSRIECRGAVRIGEHNLACSHPNAISVQDAQMALANSCNTYFATIARQMHATDLVRELAAYGVVARRVPVTPDERALLALGLEDVMISPRQLARAYQRLAMALERGAGEDMPIRNGLLESVRTGMARAAQTRGVLLGGKTGSAHDASVQGQHGWFAGIVFDPESQGTKAERVLVIEVPGGNGNDAALLAHTLLEKVH